MHTHVLTDPKTFPTDELIATTLGKGAVHWQAFFEQLHEVYPELATEWRYYNDGKAWLMKITRKKKTVVWLGVYGGYFRITAYLTEKARAAVKASALSDDCKEQFATSKRFGKLIAVSVACRKKSDVKDGLALIELKQSLK